jgi:hypothetical protein
MILLKIFKKNQMNLLNKYNSIWSSTEMVNPIFQQIIHQVEFLKLNSLLNKINIKNRWILFQVHLIFIIHLMLRDNQIFIKLKILAHLWISNLPSRVKWLNSKKDKAPWAAFHLKAIKIFQWAIMFKFNNHRKAPTI